MTFTPRKTVQLYFAVSLLITISSCTQDRSKEIDKRMRHYDELILKMDYDVLAKMYFHDGELCGENQTSIVGSDSIRKFLQSFQAYKVLEYKSITKSTVFKGDTAIQEGTYFQKVKPPQGDTLELGGQYRTTWLKEKDQWLIKKMYTHDYRNLKEKR